MKLQHEFEVSASPATTLEFLLDPDSVVSCMPGATLVEVAVDGTWKTTMAVKLGPIGMDFLNDVQITEQDAAEGTVRLSVTGRDKRGKGRADASVDARISGGEDGVTKVSMDTDVRFSGQAAQLGRPAVIEDVSSRLVAQFAERLRAQLDAGSGPPEGGSP